MSRRIILRYGLSCVFSRRLRTIGAGQGRRFRGKCGLSTHFFYFRWLRMRKSKLTTPFWSRSAMIEMLRVMLYSP